MQELKATSKNERFVQIRERIEQFNEPENEIAASECVKTAPLWHIEKRIINHIFETLLVSSLHD